MTERPGLRDVYDRLAEQLGPQLAELTASDRFAEAVEVADAVRVRASNELQRSSRRFLHAVNLPAGSDVSVLRQEIGALERTVRTLTRQVETLQRQLDEATAERAASASRSTKSSAKKRSGAKKSKPAGEKGA
jgi:predicted RNase H-like nuclease (RuvC/YqgF family)